MNTIKINNPKTGQVVEFETRWFSRLRQYRLPGEKFWTHSPHFPITEGAYPEPRGIISILQDLLGGAITPPERNVLVEIYIDRGLSAEERAALRQTNTLERIDNIERRVRMLVNDEVKKVADGETEKANLASMQKFMSTLPIQGNRIVFPCGHSIMRRGAVAAYYDRMIRDHPKLKEVKCSVCLKPFSVDVMKQ